MIGSKHGKRMWIGVFEERYGLNPGECVFSNVIRIRKYRNSDLKEVTRLVYSLFMKHVIKDANAKGRIYWRKYLSFNRTNLVNLKTRYEGSTIAYVATFQSKIIGVMMGDKLEMVRLFIKDRFQRKGIGTRLMGIIRKKSGGIRV